MARKSRLKARRAVSGFLFLVFVGFTAAGIAQLRNDYFLAGTELIGWACIPLTIVLGVTLPVKCKVKRTNGKACKRWAYGFLIGCYDVPGHWKEKFMARLHLTHEEEKPIARRQPA